MGKVEELSEVSEYVVPSAPRLGKSAKRIGESDGGNHHIRGGI